MSIKAGLFDLDGVLTDTSGLHFRAWKQLFDQIIHAHASETQQQFVHFTPEEYHYHVNGKSRDEGIISFLNLRKINIISTGKSLDELSKAKQMMFMNLLNQGNIDVFPSTIHLIHELRAMNIKTAIVSSSKNCHSILKKTQTEDLFLARVDGNSAEKLGLASKPSADLFLEAAKLINVTPAESFIVEDTLSGVQAGRNGGFALVIGIDRSGRTHSVYKAHGADLVVRDLCEVNARAILS